jgi:hypothetical protein
VDKDMAGSYELRYSVINSAGVGSRVVARTVIVRNEASYLEGTYLATHRCNTSAAPTPDFQTSISPSKSVNNEIIFSKIAPVSGAIKATLKGVLIDIPVNFDKNDVRYSGSGSVKNNSIEINFQTDSTYYNYCSIEMDR